MIRLRELFGSRADGSGLPVYGDYRALERVASGRLSTLYRGEHVRTGGEVAIKVLSEYGCRVANKLTLKLGKQWEGQRALTLQHPNVVRAIACGKERGQYYIVMEFLTGGNLTSLLHANSPSVKGRKIEIMRQAAQGLEYVHSQGVIHRDVCLRNIMLSGKGEAKLIDFGVAANKGDRIRDTGNRTGRPAYMAPELIRLNHFDERTDLYAYGVSLYEIACGRKPYHTSDDPFETLSIVLNSEIPRPSKVRPSISPRLEHVILTALAPDPVARYPMATQLLSDLADVTDDDL